jgi:hypothetical protein
LALEGGVGVWGDFHIVEAKETWMVIEMVVAT